MWIYWILFLWPALMAIGYRSTVIRPKTKFTLVAFTIILTLIIGLRFEVGVDWEQYVRILYSSRNLDFQDVIKQGDIGYGLLNWLAAAAGVGIWFVNLGAAVAFATGFSAFCLKMPNPWLAMTVGMPYMAIVMAMNYTRQGAAFGLALIAILALQENRTRRFFLFIIAAALFHKTAVILLPLVVINTYRQRWWSILGIALFSVLAFFIFLFEWQEGLYAEYILGGYESGGAWARVLMNAAAAAAFLLFRRKFHLQVTTQKFWVWISIITILFIPAMALSPSSTAIDRVALYFMPIQLFVFSSIPNVLSIYRLRNQATIFVIAGYAVVLYVWFVFGTFSYAWLPYKLYPFGAEL